MNSTCTHTQIVGKAFKLNVAGKELYFGVNQWLSVTDETSDIAKEHHLSGFINASGFMIDYIDQIQRKVVRICTNSNYGQNDNQFGEVPEITIGTDELGLIVSSRIFDDEDEDERIYAEEIPYEDFNKHKEALIELNLL